MDGWIGLDGFENVRKDLKNIHVFGEYCNNKKTKQIFVPEFDIGQIAHTCVGYESFLFRTV